jgi:regulator of RNase E activity RraA
MKDYDKPSKEIVEKFKKFSTCNVSDALDKIGLKSGIWGINPFYECKKIVGTALTMRLTAEGMTKNTSHLGADVIDIGEEGDIIVIDNAGRLDQNCWGGILTHAAQQKGIEGVVIDGAFRDVDELKELKYPVYARGVIPRTARGRFIQESYNKVIQCGGVQVRPGDIVMADENGIVIVPKEKAEEVLEISEELLQKEESMVKQLKEGIPFKEVDRNAEYNKMVE